MFDNLDDPRVQMQLAMAFGLLGGKGKGIGGLAQSAGQAGLLGINAYSRASEDKRRNALADMQTKFQGLQYEQAQRGLDYQRNYDTLAKKYFNPGSPGVQPLTPNDDEGNQMPSFPAQAPVDDPRGFIAALPFLGGQGVKDSIAFRQALIKESPYTKVDPTKLTPEARQRFDASVRAGNPDYSILEEKVDKPTSVRELEYALDAAGIKSGTPAHRAAINDFVAKTTGGLDVFKARLSAVDTALNIAKARDDGVSGVPGLPSFPGFMTGGVSGPIARPGGAIPQAAPQSAPQAPVAVPAGVPGLSPKQAREVAFDAAKQGALADEKSARGGRDVLALLDKAEAILPNATGTIPGRGVDMLARLVNQPTTGDKATAQLETIAGALLSKMPRMEGPQSNYDVENYKKAAGDLANPLKPVEVRMAALQTLKDLNAKYAPQESKQAAQPEVKQVKIGNKSYDARRGKHGKYYVQMGNTYYEVTE